MEKDNMKNLIVPISIIVLLIPLLLACSSTSYEVGILSQIINTFSVKMKKVNNFTLVALGYERSTSSKLQSFVLRFTALNHVNVDEARELLISSCEQLLVQINANEKVKPWLADYPYTGNNLDVILSFNEDEYFKRVSPPYIASISALNGRLFYATYENGKFTNVHKETYEEALKIYQDNHPEIQNSFQP
jgi:hypothetical protein